jgi:hypothetical protein
MLGFRNGGRRVNNTFGDSNKNFLIEKATCPSGATSWDQCTQYFAKTCGPADEELAVECNRDVMGVNVRQILPLAALPGTGGNVAVPPQINVTYLNGTTTASCTPTSIVRLYAGDLIDRAVANGYVQVFNGTSWGFVCSDNWNQAASRVVCKQLCYGTNAFEPLPGVIAASVPDPSNKLFLLPGFSCLGNESSLLDCPVLNASAVCRQNGVLAGVQCNQNYDAAKNVIAPDVNCSSDILVANFSRFPLITVNNIYMVNSVPTMCMNLTSSQAGVIATISVTSACGVQLVENSTHITYTVPIRYIWVSDSKTYNSYNNMRYDLVCSVGKNYQVTNRLQPYTLAPNMTIYQQYNYSLSLDLYTNVSFTSLAVPVGSVFMLEVGQWLIAAVTINNYDSRTKLVITDCDAYPVMPYTAYSPVVKLIQDKCPVESTLTIYSLENRRQGFQMKVFTFVGYSMAYIRCSVNVCMLDSTAPECDRACTKPVLGRRRKRQASNEYRTSSVDTATIFVYDTNDAGIAKIIAASGQKSQESNNAPLTSTVAEQIISLATTTTTRQQTTTAEDQQPSVTSTLSPSSTEIKLTQLLQQSSDGSSKQTTGTPQPELTSATRASATITATSTTTVPKEKNDQEAVKSAQPTKATESLGDTPSSTASNIKVEPVSETTAEQRASARSTPPIQTFQHPQATSEGLQTTTSTTKKPEGISSTSGSTPNSDASTPPPNSDASTPPPNSDASTRPPNNDASTRPPNSDASTRPPNNDASTRPPNNDASTRPPNSDASTPPPNSDASTRPPNNDASTRPPNNDASTRPPNNDASTRPPNNDASTRPPNNYQLG